MLRISLGVLISATLCIGAVSVLSRPDDPDLVVAPDGSDTDACTLVAPCASLDRAYQQARPGQTIEVAEGVYGPQVILRDEHKTGGGHVVVRPRPGARVVLRGLEFGRSGEPASGPRRLTVETVTIADGQGRQRGVAAHAGTSDVLLRDVDAANFYLNGVEDFTVNGGDWGPCRSTSTSTQSNEVVDGCSNSKIDDSPVNDDITVEDAVFHDYRIVPNSDAHFECLIVFGGTDITIRRNRFVNCEFYDVFVQHSSTTHMNGMRIENNWFDVPWNGSNAQNRPGALAFSPRGRAFQDVLIRFNSFLDGGLHVNEDGDGVPYRNFRVIGNIGRSAASACYPSASYRANLWVGDACHPSDRTAASFPYAKPVKGRAGDYHLTGGAAVDLVEVGGSDAAVPADIDHRPRPLGYGRDAGAHELR